MNIQKSGYLSIEQLTDRYLNPAQRTGTERTTDGLTFEEVLQTKTLQGRETNGLKFSKHAAVRLADRNIELSTKQLERLNEGAKKAKQKGIRDSLVIVDEIAFIVNVPSQTVVTAMVSAQTSENVFTNINGAVII